MKLRKELLQHFVLLAVAVALAAFFWLRDQTPDARAREMVEVWPGVAKQVETVQWEGENRSVSLEAKHDEQGRFYVGTVEEQVTRVKAKAAPDAGADADLESKPPEATTEEQSEVTHFVAVGEADELLKQLAPLRAYRAIGRVDAEREAEFGLDKPKGTLRVTIGGQQRSLVIGGAAPGDTDYYARQPDSGDVYAISGDIVRRLMAASSRLAERELHHFEADQVTRVVLTAGDVSRELLRIEGQSGNWARGDTPGQQDETAGNWMTKLDRLRVTKYEAQPSQPPEPVVHVTYYDGRRQIGFLDLARVSGDGDHPDFVVRTEYTRWYGKVFRSSAEQLTQDLPSVLR